MLSQEKIKLKIISNISSVSKQILLNEHGVRENGKIKIYGYKTEWKNLSNQARDGTALAIKRN